MTKKYTFYATGIILCGISFLYFYKQPVGLSPELTKFLALVVMLASLFIVGLFVQMIFAIHKACEKQDFNFRNVTLSLLLDLNEGVQSLGEVFSKFGFSWFDNNASEKEAEHESARNE